MVTPWVSTRGSLLLVRINYVYLFKLKIMSILKFSDNEEFDLSGPLRVIERSDGWYVLGNNRMIPVSSQSEGLKLIETLKNKI
jgi:hypothetical protein